MADWLDDLLQADFEGAPFYVIGSDMPVGKRINIHAYPFSDAHWTDEMGQEVRTLNVRAFILDKDGDLTAQRKALFTKLNAPGVGILTHPRLGELTVLAGRARWSTSNQSGGREDFTLTFHPPGANLKTTSVIQTDKAVFRAADKANTAVAARFDLNLTVPNAVEHAQTVLNVGLDALRSINGQISAATKPVSDIALIINNIGDQSGELLHKPAELMGQIGSVFAAVYGSVNTAINGFSTPSELAEALLGERSRESVRQAFQSYRAFDETLAAISAVPGTTPNRAVQRSNQAQLVVGLKTAALLELSRYVVTQSRATNVSSNTNSPFDSVDAARTASRELVSGFDDLAEVGDGDVYHELVQLRAAVIRHLESHGQSLPYVSTVKFGRTLPALVIAHHVYGDATRADDIVRRNNIAHPLFVPATSLEVLREH